MLQIGKSGKGRIVLLSFLVVLAACGGGGGGSGSDGTPPGKEITPNQWVWISGSNLPNQPSVYGTKGVADSANVPGGRASAVSWVDGDGNFWLFGGYVATGPTTGDSYNDLWKFDGTNWVWLTGSNSPNQPGTYSAKGTLDAANTPGGRNGAAGWIDQNGNLWLFGGYGYDSAGVLGYLNDLWMFDGSTWIWVAGSDLANQSSVGALGVGSASNTPGGRSSSARWKDATGRLWLFGGSGRNSGRSVGFLNDLWTFDGTNWTLVSGGSAVNAKSYYGVKGVAAGTIPGGRSGALSWVDANGDFWLHAGVGYSADPNSLNTEGLADLWKFDGSHWIWMSGSSVANVNGIYGSKGVRDIGNMPGARSGSAGWLDSNGHMWVLGGYGRDSAGNPGPLNDMWMFDGVYWTWMLGSDVRNGNGTYGRKGVGDSGNIPGARYNVSWTCANGHLWLFGGSTPFYANDLWRFGL